MMLWKFYIECMKCPSGSSVTLDFTTILSIVGDSYPTSYTLQLNQQDNIELIDLPNPFLESNLNCVRRDNRND